MNQSYPGWRSLLFIPAHIDKFVDKAHSRGADAYILDLEDSVPLQQKALARKAIKNAVEKVSVDGAAALVRINLDEELANQDIDASVVPGVKALVIPKVENAAAIKKVDQLLSTLEEKRGLDIGSIKLIAMIESVEGLAELNQIAASSPRLCAMTLGSEDFSASAGMQATTRSLTYPNQKIVFACRLAGITPLGFPGSIADYADMDQFTETIRFARELGLLGAFCIHPKQAQVLNTVLTPSEEEVDRARRLITAFEDGLEQGKGAVEFEGKMIDLPVVAIAKETIRSFEKLTQRKLD